MRFLTRVLNLSGVMMLLATSVAPSLLLAQGSDTALLCCTVADSSGAVIAGVAVTMTNVGHGITEKRTTDQAGRYVFTDLKPAAYTAKVEATGFKTLIREN